MDLARLRRAVGLSYSARMVTMGSTRVPSTAGIQLAPRPATARISTPPASVRGSPGSTYLGPGSADVRSGAATLLLVAMVAGVLPARRATRVDPREALQAD